MANATHEVILNDGTKLSDLILNGNNFYSATKFDTTILSNSNLTSFTIDGEEATNYTVVVLDNDVTGAEGAIKAGTRFIIRPLTEAELKEIELNAKLEYLAAMTDVEF